MRTLYFIFIFAVSVSPTLCDHLLPPSIKGQVLDSSTGEPLSGAHVQLVEAGIITATDNAGLFEFTDLTPGVYTLVFTYIGYKSDICNIRVMEGMTAYLTTHLQRKYLEQDTITVRFANTQILNHIIIDQQTIRESTWRDAGDALQTVPGAQIYQSGGLGGKKTVSLRGCRPDQIVVQVDGITLNDGTGAAVDLSSIPINAIYSIEVLPSSGIEGGPGAIGGLILITTLEPRVNTNEHKYKSYLESDFTPQINIEYENEEARAHQFRFFGDDYLFNMSTLYYGRFIYDPGDFIYQDEQNRKQKRLNNRLLRISLGASMQKMLRDCLLTITSTVDGSDGGNSTPLYQSPTPEANNRYLLGRYAVDLKKQFDVIEIQNNWFLTFRSNEFTCPERQYNPRTGTYAIYIPVDYEEKSKKYGVNINLRYKQLLFNTIYIIGKLRTGVVGESFESMNYEDDGSVTDRLLGKVKRTDLWALTSISLVKLYTSIKPSLDLKYRTDYLLDKLDGTDAASSAHQTVQALFSLNHSTISSLLSWNLFLSVGSSFSPPPFSSTFLVENVFARGNPTLKPELGNEITVGGGISFPKNRYYPSFTTTIFKRVTKDLVIWRRNSRGQYFPQNVGRAVAQGLEISLQTGRAEQLINLGGNLNLQEIINDDPQSPYFRKIIPFQPVYYGSAQLTINPLPYKICFETRFSGRRYTSESNLDPYSLAGGGLSPYKVINAWVSRELKFDPITLRVTLAVDNMLSEEYELLDRMPMPLRVWRIALGMEWR